MRLRQVFQNFALFHNFTKALRGFIIIQFTAENCVLLTIFAYYTKYRGLLFTTVSTEISCGAYGYYFFVQLDYSRFFAIYAITDNLRKHEVFSRGYV